MRHLPTGAALVATAAVAAAIANWALRPAPTRLDGHGRPQHQTSASVALAPTVLSQALEVEHEDAPRPAPAAREPQQRPAQEPQQSPRAAPSPEARALAAEREREAIAALRAINRAQQKLQPASIIDNDGDGAGEFGYLGELMGVCRLRKHVPGEEARTGRPGMVLDPPLLPADFGVLTTVGEHGALQRGAYAFRVHLPDASTEAPIGAVGEAAGGGAGAVLPGAFAEVLWCCYAWPVEASDVPLRTFFVNQEGTVLVCGEAEEGYFGAHAPRFDAALSDALPGDMRQPLGLESLGLRANDGFVWNVVAN